MTDKIYRAIGLMSGTSMDGTDVALLDTDGHQSVAIPGMTLFHPYSDDDRELLRSVQGGKGPIEEATRLLTDRHVTAVLNFIQNFNLSPQDIDLIGFHGQTIMHDPSRCLTWQIGDGQALASGTGIATVANFRVMDVAAGGQGAPLVPLYHQALAASLPKPVAILNIGGVANVTYIGANDELVAFDTGPGNALLDDWLLQHRGVRHDEGGQLARSGRAFQNIIDEMLEKPYLAAKPPKSLDRHDFHGIDLNNLTVADGAATLLGLTVQTIAAARAHFPELPKLWLVTGGGRHNTTMMEELAAKLQADVRPVDSEGWNGDFMEAEAFAYLAVRSKLGLPITLPETTGGPLPLTGGRLYLP